LDEERTRAHYEWAREKRDKEKKESLIERGLCPNCKTPYKKSSQDVCTNRKFNIWETRDYSYCPACDWNTKPAWWDK